ncbi:MAG: FAD-binding protein [Xanthomonadales bacterium]|jgi:D-lactate dehydrogenase|nr:FAD-binding protein [Xanthomonadales bacterium]
MVSGGGSAARSVALAELDRLLGLRCLQDVASRAAYGQDNSRRHALPLAVLQPVCADEVCRIVQIAAAAGLPLTARGRGTGTTGAAVPLGEGLLLSFERMDRLIAVQAADRYAVVEPGLLNGALQQALVPRALFWAPDPTSAPYSTIGGNLACNAGGPRTVKYGASRDNVLGLEFVDGRGERIRTGTRTTKGATGYDLTRLLVGSEGTLGLIVEATLKLLPLPAARAGFLAVYADIDAATAAVVALMAQPELPAALEFMDDAALALLRARGVELPEGNALLLVDVEGSVATLAASLAALSQAARVPGLLALRAAEDVAALEQLWAARKALSPALRSLAPGKINEDVVVPVSQIPALCRAIAGWRSSLGLPIVVFGHAGNGNLHVNFLYEPADADQYRAAHRGLAQLFETVLALGGTLSGEHGIGLDKRDWLPQAVGLPALTLMRQLKSVFDPAGILNPGKVFTTA